MKCPQKYVALLGQMFDWELAQLAGVPPTQAREWRLDAGISPACKGCRNRAPSKCPHHTEETPLVPDEQLDLDAMERELAVLDRKQEGTRKRVDDLIQQLRRTYEVR
jgi:hypothetical protein